MENVGAGLASGAAARTLREEGFAGQLVVVGAEPHPPYERPPLSKDYLRGESHRADAYVEPEGYWAERDVEVIVVIVLAGSLSQISHGGIAPSGPGSGISI